jgi:hypothetical protein
MVEIKEASFHGSEVEDRAMPDGSACYHFHLRRGIVLYTVTPGGHLRHLSLDWYDAVDSWAT